MKNILVNIIRFLAPQKLKNVLAEPLLEVQRQSFERKLKFINLSYSQEGEDLFLKRFFGFKEKGFYVDIGAHHPERFSNTFIFYQQGWRGINVDAMPQSMEAFRSIRTEDINLEIGIGKTKNREVEYHIFDEPALNTFSKEVAQRVQSNKKYKLIETLKIPTTTLEDILDTYLPINTTIDFISIDVEGLDLIVLQSNNWKKYRPTLILVESSQVVTIKDHLTHEINLFLEDVGYMLIGKTVKTLVFQKNY